MSSAASLATQVAFRTGTRITARRAPSAAKRVSTAAMASFHDFKGKTLGGGTRAAPTEGVEHDFSQYKGKVVLINNVATM